MDYVMRRRSTVGGALEMFSLPLPLPLLLVSWLDSRRRLRSASTAEVLVPATRRSTTDDRDLTKERIGGFDLTSPVHVLGTVFQ